MVEIRFNIPPDSVLTSEVVWNAVCSTSPAGDLEAAFQEYPQVGEPLGYMMLVYPKNSKPIKPCIGLMEYKGDLTKTVYVCSRDKVVEVTPDACMQLPWDPSVNVPYYSSVLQTTMRDSWANAGTMIQTSAGLKFHLVGP